MDMLSCAYYTIKIRSRRGQGSGARGQGPGVRGLLVAASVGGVLARAVLRGVVATAEATRSSDSPDSTPRRFSSHGKWRTASRKNRRNIVYYHASDVPWCIGRTGDFDSLSPGSNPGGTTSLRRLRRLSAARLPPRAQARSSLSERPRPGTPRSSAAPRGA